MMSLVEVIFYITSQVFWWIESLAFIGKAFLFFVRFYMYKAHQM